MTTPACPTVQLSDAAVADLQLLLDGIRLPWQCLGSELDPTKTSEGAVFPDCAVAVPPDLAAAVREAGGALLVDRELTPLATIRGAAGEPSPDGLQFRGKLQPERPREARLFAELAERPGAASGPVILAARPALIGEIPSGATVLVPTENPTPDGIPPRVLLQSIRAELPEGAKIIASALYWRDPVSDAALIRELIQAYGGVPSEVLGENPVWQQACDSLADGSPLPAQLGASVREVLRGWRPPRNKRGLVLLFSGFSGSGKSTLARDVAQYLSDYSSRTVSLLDGDDLRRMLSAGLGFDRAARIMNVRRIGFVAAEVARHGGVALCAPIAPYAETRAEVREMIESVGDFLLIHVNTPLAECERRDLKGLYAKARSGEIKEFTGISDPYDVPTDAALQVDTSILSRTEALKLVTDHLRTGGWLTTGDTP